MGTNYAGFQLQAGPPTIQGELEQALRQFTKEPVRIRGASRTDSGAHAKGQVVDFLTRTRHPVERFPAAMNNYLPDDVRVLAARQVDAGFNSRRNALGRRYQYRILDREWPSPLRRHTHFWVRDRLDTGLMNEAAQHLVGTHDFRPIAVGHPQDRSAVRKVKQWKVTREDDTVVIESQANGFLKQQIRKANGILTEIGKGKHPVELIKRVLDGESTRAQLPMLPAHGLCLIEVEYPESLFDPITESARLTHETN